MNNLEYLKSFTINEIANKTHLDKFTVKAIIEKDYEKLLNVNIKMNIKILEREYNVNFEEWLKEFNAYKENNFKENDEGFRVKPKVVGFENDKKEEKGGVGFFFFVILLIAAIAGGIYYYYEYFEKENLDIKESVNLVLNSQEDAKASVEIIENDNSTPEEKQNDTEKAPKEEAANEEVANQPTNKEEEAPKEENKETTEEKQATTNETTKEEVATQEIVEEDKQTEVAPKSEHKLYLNPKKKSWVSVKDLTTNETKNYMLERGVSFDKDSLIFIANHIYTLELDGKNMKVPNNNNARYILFKDGKVKFLTQAEYMKLDKAK